MKAKLSRQADSKASVARRIFRCAQRGGDAGGARKRKTTKRRHQIILDGRATSRRLGVRWNGALRRKPPDAGAGCRQRHFGRSAGEFSVTTKGKLRGFKVLEPLSRCGRGAIRLLQPALTGKMLRQRTENELLRASSNYTSEGVVRPRLHFRSHPFTIPC